MYHPAISPKMLFRVEASRLSLDDKFMNYEPRTGNEVRVKNELVKLINNEMDDFYCTKIDPSFTWEGEITFRPGLAPAVGKSCSWWLENAKKIDPKRNSRLGTKDEYMVFLGVLIKMLVDNNWRIDKAWNVVCNDSSEIGHYRRLHKHFNPKHAHFPVPEPTGSVAFSGIGDLANVTKILAPKDESDSFWTASGTYNDFGQTAPIASVNVASPNCNMLYSVGWIVFDK